MENIKLIKVESAEQLNKELARAGKNSSLRVFVLKFENEDLFAEENDCDDQLVEKIKHFPLPIITIIRESAKENTFKIMLAGHICFATNDAEFSIDDKKDIALEIGSKNAEKLRGVDNVFNAETALDLGLINKIAENERLEEEALEMAKTISNSAPIAVRYCLKAVNEGLELSLEDGLKLETELFTSIFTTKDMKEGTSAFLEKRKPHFKGE